MRWRVVLIFCFACTLAWGQESKLGANFRGESERLFTGKPKNDLGEGEKPACGSFSFKSVPGCAYALFTDHPLHIAAGSLPPQNGFGLGLAFVTEEHTPNWRISWDVDAVSAVSVTHSPSGSWRAGGYMKIVHTPREKIHISVAEPEVPAAEATGPKLVLHPNTVYNVYAQAISLNRLEFFGLDNTSTLAGESVFGMTQTIVGGSVVKPIFEVPALRWLNLSLHGEMNGRFVDIRGEHDQAAPSIETLYVDAPGSAPGLSSQPGFVQFGEGVRVRPMIGDRFQFDYLGKFEQFVAPGSSQNSFRRWTVDLKHTLYLYGHTGSARQAAEALGPDSCALAGAACPPVSYSRNRNGSISVRVLLSESIAGAGSAVPFYFQQTLGGSDIDGAMGLPSYHDYRFRAPNVLLLQETFEHSIWGPFGVKLMADQGRVALTRGDVDFTHLKHSFAGGLTLRAGSFPYVNLMFAWGGPEGHHNIFAMDTSLLGSSARPSLY